MEEIVPRSPVKLSLSVVSHGQLDLINDLMKDIQVHCTGMAVELILTLNLPEPLNFESSDFSFPIRIIQNQVPKGFGANHNQAFKHASGYIFCVLNPDIRFSSNPFPGLLACFDIDGVGVVAPLVYSRTGELEDSFRRFPTPWILLKKVFGSAPRAEYCLGNQLIEPDWVGGMFMVFSCSVFSVMQGFDERYFLYYEDVDLCGRLQLAGYRVWVCPHSHVVHHAQRASHRSLKYLSWHIASIVRFFLSTVYRQLKSRQSK